MIVLTELNGTRLDTTQWPLFWSLWKIVSLVSLADANQDVYARIARIDVYARFDGRRTKKKRKSFNGAIFIRVHSVPIPIQFKTDTEKSKTKNGGDFINKIYGMAQPESTLSLISIEIFNFSSCFMHSFLSVYHVDRAYQFLFSLFHPLK